MKANGKREGCSRGDKMRRLGLEERGPAGLGWAGPGGCAEVCNVHSITERKSSRLSLQCAFITVLIYGTNSTVTIRKIFKRKRTLYDRMPHMPIVFICLHSPNSFPYADMNLQL